MVRSGKQTSKWYNEREILLLLQRTTGYIKARIQSSRKIPNLWFTNVTYAGTKSTAIVGGARITCDIAWLDNIRGGKNLGYGPFRNTVLKSKLELRNARGRRVDISRPMGEILTESWF